MCKTDDYKKIEKHLKNYKSYKLGLQNMKKQLDNFFPKITTSYEQREGSTGGFSTRSNTEEYGIKRIEKKAEMDLYIRQYGFLIESIDSALKQLDPIERSFVEERYFNNRPMKMLPALINCPPRSVYTIRDEVKSKFLITLQCLVHLEA